jgi:hypothetical protein
MIARAREHLSYANVMATIAVFVALGGSAYALTRGEVKTKHIAARAVTVPKLAPSARSQTYTDGQTSSTGISSGGTTVATLTLPPGRYLAIAKAIVGQSSTLGAPTCELRNDGVDLDRAAADLAPGDTQTVSLVAGTTDGGTVTLVCTEDGGSTDIHTRRLVATRVAGVTAQ